MSPANHPAVTIYQDASALQGSEGRARLSTLLVAFILISIAASALVVVSGRAAGSRWPTTLGKVFGSRTAVAKSAGLAEGAPVNVNGTDKTITYHGGDGNDVELIVTTPVPPVNLVVTKTDDTDDHDCSLSDCSLREAIEAANSDPDTNTITFDIPIGTDSGCNGGSGPCTITLGFGELNPQSNMSINGPTAYGVIVSGANSSHAFDVTGGNVNISNLTITNGEMPFGGGLGTSSAGTLTVTDCTISGNHASNGGGGINNDGTLTVINSTISDNSSGGGGAGIRNRGTLTLVNSTISGNFADRKGGGLLNDSNGGTGIAHITNSTITNNIANYDDSDSCDTSPCDGGGIYNNGPTVTLRNTIVAGNFYGGSFSAVANDITGNNVDTANSLNNLIGIGSGGLTNSNGNQVGVEDPRLGPLQNNGGPTFTHALLGGGPAIDAGDDCVLTGCGGSCPVVNTDQRGVTRPQSKHVDIGAFELQAYVVNTTADHDDGQCSSLLDEGDCTLREAIKAANADFPSPRMIVFDIPTSGDFADGGCDVNGVCTIKPSNHLPALCNTVFIDGYSQTGAKPNTKDLDQGDNAYLKIVLDGCNVSYHARGLELQTDASGSTIRGLVIHNFAQADIYIEDDGGDTISGNFLGTDVTGTIPDGTSGTGVTIKCGEDDVIGGDTPADRNLISGHTNGIGIKIEVSDNFVEGNYIGTDRTGCLALPNRVGVSIKDGSGNTIGCEVLNGDNVISGNTDSGVKIEGGCENYVQGNFIGTDRTGCVPVPNGIGVSVCDSLRNSIGLVFRGGAFGNLISGNNGDGVLIRDTSVSLNSMDNIVEGNFIGTNRAGNAAVPNTGAGVELDGASGNTIGGVYSGRGNVISGNGGDGVRIAGGASSNYVQGNFIGLKADCVGFLGNGESGVEIVSVVVNQFGKASAATANEVPDTPGSTNNLIGDFQKKVIIDVQSTRFAGKTAKSDAPSSSASQTTAANAATEGAPPPQVTVNNSSAANVIAGNTLDGVRIVNDGDINNLITQNSIYHNGKLGINLVNNVTPDPADGVTDNDTGDGDEGPNYLQNFPVITLAAADIQTISGTLDSSGSGPYTIEFFTNYVCDGSGHGEGKDFFASTTTSDSTFSLTAQFSTGQIITATATDSNGNTSEFSACFVATPTTPPPCPTTFVVTSNGDDSDTALGDGHCDTDGNLGNGDQCTLRAAIEEANELTSCGTITIDATGVTGTINLGTGLPSIDHNVNINGPAASALTVQRNSATGFRIFTINPNRTVSISGLTISNGSASIGGGIYNNRGTLTITDCAISGNTATSFGGGIHNGGSGSGNAALTIIGSTISGNSSAGSSSTGDGGGVYSDAGSGTASLTVINSTVSGNTANNHVGGVYVISSPATLTNVTITNNRADNDDSGIGAAGGLSESSGVVTLHNTIVAGNFHGTGAIRDDINGLLELTSSYNLIGDGTGINSVGSLPANNQIGTSGAPIDPLITPLANNGGPTLTHATLYNSPAIDKGDNLVTGSPLNLATDQRGSGYDRQANGDLDDPAPVVDIGAYERQATESRNLPFGSSVQVDLVDARLTFPCVPFGGCGGTMAKGDARQTSTGISPAGASNTASITVIDPALQPSPPPGYVVGTSSSPVLPAFDVSTTVTYDTPVQICFYLPTITNAGFFDRLKILHNEGGVLFPVPSSKNFASKLVCGSVSSLSPFVIASTLTPTAANGDVRGQIVDSNGNPVEGAAVRMSGTQNRLTVTDAAGNYRFDNVETNGFYTVAPARANYTFSPLQRSFSALGQHTDATFNATAAGNSVNPLDTSEYFVRQQYLDFLGREPDEAGLNFWVNNIDSCGADANCRAAKRIDTSAAFFLSIEFQQTGYLVYRTYQAAYGDMPGAPVPIKLGEFKPDTADIGNGVIVNQTDWQATLEQNKVSFMAGFVQRSRFISAFPTTLTPSEFVDDLFANAGVTPAGNDRTAAINEFGPASTSTDVAARGRALRRVAENSVLARQEFNQAFVLMQYFGYLRRDANSRPDADFSGFSFWLEKLNAFDGNFGNADMVKAFLLSGEYRGRFPR